MPESNERYLSLLAKGLPSKSAVQAELARIAGERALPKPPEIYVSDVHGEYGAFSHVIRNGAGSIRRTIDALFPDMKDGDRAELATLIYYPTEKIALWTKRGANAQKRCASAIKPLARVLASFASAYTHEHVRSTIEGELAPVVEELICMPSSAATDAIVASAASTGCADELVLALAHAIKRLAVARIHLVGDIYDRGPAPERILDAVGSLPNIDVQWGNHDVVWMGAALGSAGCIAHVVRNCARYGNLSVLTDSYGINLITLWLFALDAYRDDPCAAFGLKGGRSAYPELTDAEYDLTVKVQKAMAIIEFKVEAKIIARNPSFHMEDRNLLGAIDFARGTIDIDGVTYPLADTVLPTVDPAHPLELTPAEASVVESLQKAFTGCERLQEHMRTLLDKGSMYRIENNVLMFHACVPLNPDGSLLAVNLFGKTYKGRALFDAIDGYVRDAFAASDARTRQRGADLLWYLWLGQGSPLFAKSKMATFEIYFVNDKNAKKESRNAFYTLYEDKRVLDGIFRDFGMDPAGARIVCGHVPVKVSSGENPLKCGGVVIDIDGGMSKPYQSKTGIAGFALVSDGRGLVLNALDPLESTEAAVRDNLDLHPTPTVVSDAPVRVADTDEGTALAQCAENIKALLSV